MAKHLSPSDIRRRETRKAERTALAAAGLLVAKPKTFTLRVWRQNPRRAVAESPNSQQDLNRDLCCSVYELATMEHTKGRVTIMADGIGTAAAELAAKGWTRL
jgi:hypothetical protein